MAQIVDVLIGNPYFFSRPLPCRVVYGPDATATVSEDEIGMLAPPCQSLTLILVRVINTPNSTQSSSNRLPPGWPCAIYRVLAATRFDTLVPMQLVSPYGSRDPVSALVCVDVYLHSSQRVGCLGNIKAARRLDIAWSESRYESLPNAQRAPRADWQAHQACDDEGPSPDGARVSSWRGRLATG